MKKIKLGYIDFWNGFKPDTFILHQMIQRYFEVEITTESPDFVICSTFGHDVYQYSCPRILYVGEAFCPDFNIYDYAIGFDRMQFGERYLRLPLCLLDKEHLQMALHKHEKEDDYYLKRDGFCSFVVSSGAGVDNLREWYFDRLSEYKTVASGGRFRNNLPDGKPVEDKMSFQENYRFSLCFENTSFPGYATEKIIDAWASGCIPIYCGDPDISKDFNEKAFLHVRSKEDLPSLLEEIKKLEENKELYLAMAHQPILCESSPIYEMLNENYIGDYLVNIFDQDTEKAFRRNSKYTMWGKFYEYQLNKLQRIENNGVVKFMRKWKRKLFGLKKIS